jgi:hypothetical protein
MQGNKKEIRTKERTTMTRKPEKKLPGCNPRIDDESDVLVLAEDSLLILL